LADASPEARRDAIDSFDAAAALADAEAAIREGSFETPDEEVTGDGPADDEIPDRETPDDTSAR